MQVVERENCVEIFDVESTYHLKFKDASKHQEFLTAVRGLLPALASESLVADEETMVDYPINSEMVVEDLAHNLDLHTSLAKKNKACLSTVHHPVVLQDKTAQINISEQQVEYEPERVPPLSEIRSQLNDISDLPATTVPQQASSNNNLRSENETVQNLQQCSETDSAPIDAIGSVQLTENTSSFVEVSIYHHAVMS